MSTTERRADRGTRICRSLCRRLAEEMREARIAAGLSQAALGRAIRVSHTHIGRLERGEVIGASLLVYCRAFSVLGYRVAAQTYPEGPPLRDAAQASLLERLRRRLPERARLLTEVLLRFADDLRSWDATIIGLDRLVRVDAETRVRDLQALDRRVALKMAADGPYPVILLLADTRANRAVVAAHRELLAARYPLGAREVFRALSRHQAPEGNAIVLV